MDTTIYAIVFDSTLKQFRLTKVVLGGKITNWDDDLLSFLLQSLAKNSKSWENVFLEGDMAFIFNADTEEGCNINVHSFLEKISENKR